MTRWRVVFLVLTIIVAGCAGQPSSPTSTVPDTTTSTSADTPALTLADTTTTPRSNGSTGTTDQAPFGIDVNATWDRVAALCNVSRPPPRVSFTEYERSDSSGERRGFERYMGIERNRPVMRAGGSASGPQGVSINYLPNATRTDVAQVLVHEFGHTVQPDNLSDRLRANGASRRTKDGTLARRAITEGAAVFVADEYAEQYLDAPTQLATIQSGWPNWTPGTRYFWAPYRFGAEHVHERVDSCADIESVYEQPPTTTEQLLHPERLGEPPADLRVNATGNDSWDPLQRNVMGELFVRTALGSTLDLGRASSAAAGWGNDSLVYYYRGTEKGYAWTIRWDDAGEAAEFEQAITEYLDARGERRNDAWRDGDRTFRYRRVAPETTVLFAGNATFVRNATASGTNTTVAVTP